MVGITRNKPFYLLKLDI